jgi:hypothetical protein
MNCPNCGSPLNPGARFCRTCGMQAVQAPPQSADQPVTPPVAQASFAGQAPVAQTVVDHSPAGYPLPGQAPAWQSPTSYPASYSPPGVAQLGATGSATNFWGPFAGHGSRREHVAWLLEDLGSQAEDLRDTITSRFSRRQIPQAQVTRVVLTGRGVAVEQRPFYRIRRDLATVWLYVARFGEDLYVSQVSYIKGKISVARVIIVAVLLFSILVAWGNTLLLFANLNATFSSAGSGWLTGQRTEPNAFLIAASCCTGPLSLIAQLVLTFGLVFSVYKFITEKDFLALLRSRPSEFQEDDIVSLEKAVSETVRQAADSIGIDRKLLAPERAYRSDRRLI